MTKTVSSLERYRHSLAHVMAQAVQDQYPNVQLGFGPSTEEGFFYDFDFGDQKLEEKDLKLIERKMRKIIGQRQEFSREEVGREEALEKAKSTGQSYKIAQIENLVSKGVESFSFYKNGPFMDLCEGPHVSQTGELPAKAFKLSHLAGAYWMGSEKNKMLTRIYAYAFETPEELRGHLRLKELAAKRDHKKLGKELELYTISDMVGKGLPLWLPNGCVIRDCIEDYAKEMEFKYGYKRVSTPHITKAELYLKSQHLPAYKDSMFPPMIVKDTDENGVETVQEEYYLKPMNCPHHHMIYKNKPRSYRELPLRLAEYGHCYRFEKSGELSGLIRVRSLCMNDAHIYLAEDQVKEEFKKTMEMYQIFYKTFNLTNYTFRLSLRGEDNREKYQGSDEMWEKSERILREAMDELEVPYVVGMGEAAFYGPKVDVQFKSLLGREETVSTIQVDFLGPKNFELNYVDEKGEDARPVIIHRAPLSTHERFISYLIEYYGGVFPTWCSPLQVVIIPTRDDVLDYSKKIEELLRSKMIRVEIDESPNSFNKKIRTNITKKNPNLLIIGDREKEEDSVTWRRYGRKEQKSLSLNDFVLEIEKEIRERIFIEIDGE